MTREQRQTSARNQVKAAIKAGVLVRQPCDVCGALRSDAHHEDYSKPLEVAWLCRTHHMWLHSHGDTIPEMQAKAARTKALGLAA